MERMIYYLFNEHPFENTSDRISVLHRRGKKVADMGELEDYE